MPLCPQCFKYFTSWYPLKAHLYSFGYCHKKEKEEQARNFHRQEAKRLKLSESSSKEKTSSSKHTTKSDFKFHQLKEEAESKFPFQMGSCATVEQTVPLVVGMDNTSSGQRKRKIEAGESPEDEVGTET